MNKLVSAVALIGTLAAAPVFATPVSGSSLQSQLTAAGATINVNADQYNPDEQWTLGSTGVASALLMFELAGYADQNTFGIYDINDTSKKLQIFSGPNGAGSRGILSLSSGNQFCSIPLSGGSSSCASFSTEYFGFYLSTPDSHTFYSEDEKNGDQVDHMVAYQGGAGKGTINGHFWLANEFIFAWEDMFGGGDHDYDDFAVVVESVTAVPEPASLSLLGLGMLGAGFGIRRRKKA